MLNLISILAIGLGSATVASAALLELPMIVDNGYTLVNLNIGTPPQPRRLLFDTGSGSTWIVDSTCARNCTNSSGWTRTGYDIDVSKTGKYTGDAGEIRYVSGSSTGGPTVEDRAWIGDVSWKQQFLAANRSTWPALPAEGFMGLAFNTIRLGDARVLPWTMMHKNVLDKPQFSLYYGNGSTDANNRTGGLLTFGGSREEEYIEGEMAEVPVVKRNGEFQLWRSNLLGISGSFTTTNGTSIPPIETSLFNNTAIFDTGAAAMYFPATVANQLYASIGWDQDRFSNGHFPHCSEFNNTWSVTFTFGGDNDEALANVTMTGDMFAMPGFANREELCWPPFQTQNSPNVSLLGKTMLSSFYTVFDFGDFDENRYKPTVSFGNLKEKHIG